MSNWIKKLLVQIAIYLIELAVDKFNDKDEIKPLVSLRQKQESFLQDAAKLIAFIPTLPGYTCTAGELWRTNEQQAIYLAKGLSKTKFSKHQDRLAIDLNLFVNGIYRSDKAAFKPIAEYWKSLSPNNVSGYDWGWDYNHFEKK